MKYINADTILPDDLLKEVQKYIQGGTLYIPNPDKSRKRWGEISGGRTYLNHRNEEIRRKFSEGINIDQLSVQFCLSCESIKKIVYTKK
ncbi:CD3324 family protein [Fontibacillus sp. BL9]|uniref:CD3324 family protein n=1 Tax=Fontibacillus sp. BL9 TaxID=3389971 RepID=UPI00397CC0FA